MSIDRETAQLLIATIENIGLEKTRTLLKETANSIEDRTLTIIANFNTHHIPNQYLRGEVYICSEGNIDFSSQDSIKTQYIKIIDRLKQKLMSKTWSKIYLIPTGHPTLSLQIKNAVYRVTRLETTDLFYSNGEYFDICINWRKMKD